MLVGETERERQIETEKLCMSVGLFVHVYTCMHACLVVGSAIYQNTVGWPTSA